jgi:hypothetical protein
MQGRKGTPWAQPGLHTPPQTEGKKEGEPQQGLRFAESPTCFNNMPFLRLMDLDNFNLHGFYKADRARLILFIFFQEKFLSRHPTYLAIGPHSYNESKGRSSLEIAPAPA